MQGHQCLSCLFAFVHELYFGTKHHLTVGRWGRQAMLSFFSRCRILNVHDVHLSSTTILFRSWSCSRGSLSIKTYFSYLSAQQNMLLVWMCKSKVTVACWCLSVLYAFLSRFMSILKDWKFVFKNRKPYHSKTRDLGVFSVVKKRLESVKFHRLSKKSLNIWLFRSKVLNAIESSMPNAWKALKASTDINCWATILIGNQKLSSTLSNDTRATKLWTALARTFRRLVHSSVSIFLFHFPTCAQ